MASGQPEVGAREQVSGISSTGWHGRMTANHTAPEALPISARVYRAGLIEQLQPVLKTLRTPAPSREAHPATAPGCAFRPVSIRGGLIPQPGQPRRLTLPALPLQFRPQISDSSLGLGHLLLRLRLRLRHLLLRLRLGGCRHPFGGVRPPFCLLSPPGHQPYCQHDCATSR